MNYFKVFWASVQYFLCLAAVIAVLIYLVQHGGMPTVALSSDGDREAAVRVVGPKRIAVTPDSRSPFNTAHCTGAAPLYFGSSDAWILTHPKRGMDKISTGSNLP